MSNDADVPSRRTIITDDAERYSKRRTLTQIDFQRDLVGLMDKAALMTGLNTAHWHRQRQGDAELIVLPPDVDESLVLAGLVEALRVCLERRNLDRSDEGRLRLRCAMHTGSVHFGANGFAGPAVVEACRMRDSDALRTTLTAAGDADLAVAVGGEIYRDIVANRLRGLRPELYEAIRMTNKEFDDTAYVSVPGHSVSEWSQAAGQGGEPEGAGTRAPEPAPSRSEGRAVSYGGDNVSGIKQVNSNVGEVRNDFSGSFGG